MGSSSTIVPRSERAFDQSTTAQSPSADSAAGADGRRPSLPAPTAENINEAHRIARANAEFAIEHAIKCGQLLIAKKESMQHGEFLPWLEANCEVSARQANRYMQAARKSDKCVGFQSLRQALGMQPTPVKKAKPNAPKGAVSVVKAARDGASATEETGAARPAAPVSIEPTEAVDDAPEMPSEDELAAMDREIQESEARVLRADDVTVGYHDELKRQAAEIAVLKVSRDGYMNGKAAVTKMLEAEQRKSARLDKENKKLRDEIESLRERIAIMEAA